MANLQSSEGPSASDVSDQSSESTLQLNIKTLDSRICSFYVDKNIVISAFKEKIASEIGVPVGQQRLIFRGKVLNDDHLLSEYRLDSTAGGPRNRIGQIPHGVALGTLNVGDAGEAGIPDLTRQPIPDSLNTITDFMNRIQLAFAQNDTQHNQSPSASGSVTASELPTNSGGYPSVEALTSVLQHAQRLLHDHAIPALCPFPLQTSSLFGGSSSVELNPVAMTPVGVGNVPRNVNIHIHTEGSANQEQLGRSSGDDTSSHKRSLSTSSIGETNQTLPHVTSMDDQKIDLRQVVQRLEDQSSSEEIFRSLIDRAAQLSSGGSADERIVNQLCSRRMSEEFMEMLHHDISQRLHDEMGS
ncbi:Large proline-rich protein BAG6 [Sesamum angolense]|uniref:Large proline-rich protein BAG6 n=1 Tax=Sesamum angolense TaxID=2727404 RepID=A0AAE1W6A8_9LAMI|nr:Large proline-rich protein BAG6 [Sesamum angolense]